MCLLSLKTLSDRSYSVNYHSLMFYLPSDTCQGPHSQISACLQGGIFLPYPVRQTYFRVALLCLQVPLSAAHHLSHQGFPKFFKIFEDLLCVCCQTGVQVISVSIGNGGLFVEFITTIPALQICFTGNVAQATAVAKTQVRIFNPCSLLAIPQLCHRGIAVLWCLTQHKAHEQVTSS